MNTQDTWSLGGREFTSRFILGSGKYSLELIEAAVRDAGAQMITLAVRRANTTEKENILDYIPQGVTLLPNTSGARNAEEAVRIACTLCVRLLEAGIKVSAYSNGLDVHSGQPMALPEVSGPGSVLALRKAFACAQAANGLEPIESFFPSGEGQRDENSLLCVLVTRDQRESLARAFAQRAGQREWLQIIPYRDEYEGMPQFGTVRRLYWEV